MTEKIKCLRCGKCCLFLNELGSWQPCGYLAADGKGFTTCTRYHKRLGTIIGPDAECVLESPYNIPGCPFNRPGKEDHPFWKEG